MAITREYEMKESGNTVEHRSPYVGRLFTFESCL